VPRLRIKYSYDEPQHAKVWVRWICLITAGICFGWAGAAWIEQRIHQSQAKESFEQMISEPVPPSTAAPKRKSRDAVPLAKLEIARLRISGYVEDGLDAHTLRRAIGHSPRSPKPGERGNVVLAAHRDTFFSGLRDVLVGDIVDLQAPGGERLHYRVSRIFVVDPVDSRVMRPSSQDMLTLITCYPFEFIGSAPSRLVVQARPIQTSETARTPARLPE
jgi:sortase A